MDFQNLSPDQIQKAFKLCDIMSLGDFYVAATLLQTYGWNVQKAIDQIVYTKQQQHNKQQQKSKPNQYKQTDKVQQNNQYDIPQQFNYQQDEDPYKFNNDGQNEDEVDYQDFQYDYPENEIEIKRKKFQQISISQVPLLKTVSQPHHMIKTLEKDKLLANDYHKHRHQYQSNLLKKSEQMCQRVLQSLPSSQSKTLYSVNNKKIINNKKFIVYLHKEYKSKINFTFGTFMLNLIRSYLDDKYLLVFILHQNSQNNGQKVIQKILNQKQFATFINNNCISYGMFDNSDDYEIVQKYVPLKDLPAFAIFKYNKKDKKQEFVSSYPLLSNGSQNCLEWVAKSIGIPLKKKPNIKKSQQKIQSQEGVSYESISDILKQQNLEYEEIQKLYHMKRLQSRMNKDKIKEKQLRLMSLKKQFESKVQHQLIPGQSIQIKFRMPISGESKLRTFQINQKIQTMFDYVQAYHQSQFQQPYCDFDLTQTFPTLSLKDKKEKLIKEVFQDSDRENIIVKEI